MFFSRDNWIGKGATSPFEFDVANKYGFAGRIDYYAPVEGLRIGLSGYYGQSMHNSYPHDKEGAGKKYDYVKGAVSIGSVDFSYDAHNIIVRGNADYGHLSDASDISQIKKNLSSNIAPYNKTNVGKNAYSVAIEAGYDIFSLINSMREHNQKFYVFGRYEAYDSYIRPSKSTQDYPSTDRKAFAVGVNYKPLPQLVVKGEYSKRLLKSQFEDEPSVSIGIAYEGFFTK